MKIIFIEGIPGTGKTTKAESLCGSLIEQNQMAYWYREECHEHPIHPIEGKPSKYDPGFQKYLLDQWEQFIDINHNNSAAHIFDASLFQTAARFMMEANNIEEIPEFLQSLHHLLQPADPKITLFPVNDVRAHMLTLIELRGSDWAHKVSAYLEKTPYCRSRGYHGFQGFIHFWEDYQTLCEELSAHWTSTDIEDVVTTLSLKSAS